ncbi:hypothetical protein VTH82DRAFT_5760 [Thermothelomyces myriococcoides]
MVLTIEISDDDRTASSVDDNSPSTAEAPRKRKLSVDFEEKVAWTDDDDSDDGEIRRPQKGSKRRAVSKGKRPTGKGAGSRTRTKTRRAAELSAEDEYADADMPDYLLQRRKAFDRNLELLREAGLRLPPDYSEIYFSDDDHVSTLEKRPRFDESSGIKPCRPYEDIELEYSAGIIPAPIAQYLRDYQIAGVQFLHQRFVYQKGCILGDDMGLGKTVQVAAFLAVAFGKTGDERDAKRMRKMRRAGDLWYPRVMIVCPGSLIQNWRNELNRWGYWHVDTYHGPGKEDVLQAAMTGRIEIMITTYVTYKKMREAVNQVEWDCVVADECHVLKDRRSETTQAMDCVNALCRIGLTGTAIQNKYEELWTILNWTNPGRFGTLAEWHNTITKPLTVGQSHDATLKQLSIARTTAKKLVRNLLPDFFLRRMKTLIADQLPRKTDKVVFCPLTDIQRDAYQNFLEGSSIPFIMEASERCDCGSKRKKGWCCLSILPNGRRWVSEVFPSILTLQKISNHITLLIPSSADPREKQSWELNALQVCVPDGWEELYKKRDSMLNLANPEFCGKWKVLRKLLHFWHDNGDKVLVFSHSVRLLRILQYLFHNTSYNVSFLDGSLSYEERQRVVDDFNSDPAQFVFLISTKAGGVGLNITSANKVVIFDPHWNPSYDLQAQDRAYRIGQTRNVDVFRLVSAGTIEEIVYARQIYKQQQANIGYNASSERRYFKGVQQDSTRKGEIFGLENLFSFRADQVVLREIVNKTNVAEAKAGVYLADIDLDRMAKDEDNALNYIKQEPGTTAADDEEAGMSQLAKLITAEDQEELLRARKAARPRTDAIAGILASAGVEYTHENSEVIGTSRVEAQLSRRAELVAKRDGVVGRGVHPDDDDDNDDDDNDLDDLEGDSALFTDSLASTVVGGIGRSGNKSNGNNYHNDPWRMHYRFNPPKDVMRRQFCSMAREFGFASATDFALVVESWTQEQRRNCLDTFYRLREARLLEKELAAVRKEAEEAARAGEVNIAERENRVKEEGGIKEEKVEDGYKIKVEDGCKVKVEDDYKVKEERTDFPLQSLAPMKVDQREEKTETVRFETEETQKTESSVMTKTTGVSKMTPIFLSSDDEDDEL